MTQQSNKTSWLSEAIRIRGSLWLVIRRAIKLLLTKPMLVFKPRYFYRALVKGYESSDSYLQAGINLIGHVYAVLGRAEDIRTAALACNSSAIDFLMINRNDQFDVHLKSVHSEFPLFDLVSSAPRFKANLFFLNADEMPLAWDYFGPEVFDRRYNIGCFAWELSDFPEGWKTSFAHLDELWAPTLFIEEALVKACDLPVVHMPFVIEPGAASDMTRADFGIPADKFLFLFFFDFRSFVSRKNPEAVLEAFFAAFADQSIQDVHLLIKVNGTEEKPEAFEAFMQDKRMQDSRVQLITDSLDDKGIKTLVSLCDCFVSLHRSEGFGRGLAEAMYYGKPVVATAYSGNMDYMTSENSCLVDYELIPLQEGDYPFWQGQVWADAKVTQAADYMRKLYEDRSYASSIGEMARQHVLTHHSSEAVGLKMRQRLEQLGIVESL